MSAVRCARRYCDGFLDARVDGLGRVAFVCPKCARNKAGVCRDCPATLADAHAMRCPACSVARRRSLGRERDRERYPTRRRQVLNHHQRRAKDPAVRARRVAYMQAWRERNPWDDQSRAYQRAYMRQRRADPAYRDKQNARKRERRAMKRVGENVGRNVGENGCAA